MKVMFDTNIYISFIRNRSHASELVRRGTVKYASATVLMELWTGAGTRKAERLLSQLQRPYEGADRKRDPFRNHSQQAEIAQAGIPHG